MTEAAIDFATYGTKPSGDRSGAYLFLPDGPAQVRFQEYSCCSENVFIAVFCCLYKK